MSGTTNTGSLPDMLARLKAALPLHWFPDATPILDGLLTGLASTAATLYGMLSYVRLQTRLATATDSFLDLAATDFCGLRLSRRASETDTVFRTRLLHEILRTRATRSALVGVLSDLTGRVPELIEPDRPADVGGWGVARGYGVAGAWGSLSMPFQCVVVAYRPFAPGAPAWTGGSGPGAPATGGPPIQGAVTDAEIYAAVAAVTPVATIAWTALSN